MSQDQEVRERVRRIETLVHQCDAIPDPGLRHNVRELIQAVMELHGTALERLLTLVSEREAEVPGFIDSLAKDQFVGQLLILHGLHPDDLQTRVARALAGIEGILRGYGAHAEILGVPDGVVRLHVQGVSNNASLAKATRAAIEDALSGAAPDAASVIILGLEQFTSSDFVALDQIRMAPHSMAAPTYAASGGD